jgi:hypothetical protein
MGAALHDEHGLPILRYHATDLHDVAIGKVAAAVLRKFAVLT